MRRFAMGRLQVMVTSHSTHRFLTTATLYVDWNVHEYGNRWRVQIAREPLWMPLFTSKPTRRGKGWAYWAIGNELHTPDFDA